MRVRISEIDAKKRSKTFEEVCEGYTEEQAIEEASRCLQCDEPKCVLGCPVRIAIPGFIKKIIEKDYETAMIIIKAANFLPGVCGRVCPQETQCEAKCILGDNKDEDPIAIGKLERFVADIEKKNTPEKPKKLKTSVAVVGSGPAGLTCAAVLTKNGHNVTVYEAWNELGGVLRFGIPTFRLPREVIEKEIEYISSMGVKFETNTVIGKTISIEELTKEHNAVFISTGAGLPGLLDIPGENLNNVYSANEFLTRINMMNANDFPEFSTPIKKAKKTVIIGGGNVAMDAARAAKRLGSDVTIVYRRSLLEMPARREEIVHAREEGINFLLLTTPKKILGESAVEGIECLQMMLGEEDDSGRKIPSPIEDSEFIISCDQVIVAIGTGPNPIISRSIDVLTTPRGYLRVDQEMRTSYPKVFAGGDIVSGKATVIKAIADGKKAAGIINNYLTNKGRG